MEFLTSSLFLTAMGLNLAAQMWTSIFLYKYQSVQLSALGQLLIILIYVYTVYHLGLPALIACVAMYIFFLLFCNRIVFYWLKDL